MSTIYDECSKDELLQIAYEMQKDLNDSKKENEEQQQTINDLQKENKELQWLLDDTRSDLIGAINDYKQATNEINLLNKQIDRQNTAVNDLSDIVETSHKVIDGLKEENDKLKFRLKMLTKVCLNSIYGITGTDNIKETKDNDDNN